MATARTQHLGLKFEQALAPTGAFNEAWKENGDPRPHWQRLLAALNRLSSPEFAERDRQAADLLTEDGANYNVFQEGDAVERPWDLDLVPLMISAVEWRELEACLSQRAELINAVLRDLYGKRTLLADGGLPPEILYAHPRYLRSVVGMFNAEASPLTLYGAELARAPDGRWWVMADRLDAPAGPAYALENRIVCSRTMPQIVQRVGVQRLAPFFVRLINALKQLSHRAVENPRVVLLSSGAKSPYYFEDVYLARYLGIDLVQGADLAAREGKVYLKTLAGLSMVDVILNRGAEQGMDPLVLGGGAVHGVPGLLNAMRHQNVVVANAPGCGLLESPVFMAFLPTLCRRFLGEGLKMPSIATWWCGDPKACQEVIARLPEMVIKPAFQASGGNEILADQLTKDELSELRSKILDRPYQYVAQQRIVRSAAPSWESGKATSSQVAVRTFLVHHDEQFHLMPGGFARTSASAGPMQLSITGGTASKDVWVAADGPVPPVSLLVPLDKPVVLRRSNAMFPSRAADDLFWLGMSLERALFLTRLYRSLIEDLTSEAERDESALSSLVAVMIDMKQIEGEYANLAAPMAWVELSEELGSLVFDSSSSHGIAAAATETLRLGGLTRDLLSQDTWRKIRRATQRYLESPKRGVDDLGEAQTALEKFGADLAAVSGMIHDGMIRGPAWRFLDLGRRLQATRTTCQFILSLASVGGLKSKVVLKSVLEVLDSRMTYRFRYLDNVQRNAVLDLAITDITNPHSIGYQLEALQQHAAELPSSQTEPLLSEEQRQLADALHALRRLTPEALAADEPKEVRKALERIYTVSTELTETLTRNYLIHSGPPRQITDEEGPPA